MQKRISYLVQGVALGFMGCLVEPVAYACGCFARPNVDTPVVQAGERILFAHRDGKVIAHVQIQYSGPAREFAWILPVPAVPVFKLGTEEVFATLESATRPSFVLNAGFACGGGGGGGCGGGCQERSPSSTVVTDDRDQVAVVASSAGPYEYAVLRADDKTAMLKWLDDNRYFIPTTTDAVLDPYVHPGAYFLVVKLRSGQDVGDLQPIVLEYESQRAMIPVVLTAAAAQPDMGVLVWILGDSRAIPVNYYNVKLNLAHLAWFDQATNYDDLVKRAVDEAPEHHAFVTEFAGSTAAIRGILDAPGRFGHRELFANLRSAKAYYDDLVASGFPMAIVAPILRRHFRVPKEAIGAGVTEEVFYRDLERSLGDWGAGIQFDAAALTDELWTRVVVPAVEAATLFSQNAKLTRLYTRLSPDEMTVDPVFAFNDTLPDVTNLRTATFDGSCGTRTLALPDGRAFELEENSTAIVRDKNAAPAAMRVEILRPEGEPEVVQKNDIRLSNELAMDEGSGGCASSRKRFGRDSSAIVTLLLLSSIVVWRHRRHWISG